MGWRGVVQLVGWAGDNHVVLEREGSCRGGGVGEGFRYQGRWVVEF